MQNTNFLIFLAFLVLFIIFKLIICVDDSDDDDEDDDEDDDTFVAWKGTGHQEIVIDRNVRVRVRYVKDLPDKGGAADEEEKQSTVMSAVHVKKTVHVPPGECVSSLILVSVLCGIDKRYEQEIKS